MIRRVIAAGALAGFLLTGQAQLTLAQSRGPTVELARTALDATSDQWIAFRNYDGRQWIYFTGIVTWHCALKQVLYSVNSEDLDQVFPLPECNEQTPYSVDPERDPVYVNMKLGSADTVAVQIVFADGTKSAINSFQPCKVEGDVTCAVLVKPNDE